MQRRSWAATRSASVRAKDWRARLVKASFVLTEFNQKIYISARAIDEVNVQIIMEELGGGGHINIAGAQLENVSLEEARVKLKEVLTQMTKEGAI